MKLLKNPYVVFPILIGLTIPTVLFIYYLTSKKSLDLSNAVYFTNKPLPKTELFNVKTDNDCYEQLKQGKILVIYLTTNCNACKKEVDLISTFYSEQTANFKIYGIALEDKNKVEKYIEQQNIKFPVLIDKEGQLLNELSVKYFPTKFLIENGIISKTVIGSSPNKDKLLQDFNLGEAGE